MNSYETELLIIGGGAAGMSAAASALEKNIKTTLVESNSQVGGNGIFPKGRHKHGNRGGGCPG
ncbi:MAG: FAD-dependent oxidoreductase [Firmicutes bacterium]|nr:FAD-dependent oxidoreductase [Bacillota bacterium]